jgi:hypothetical protein
MIQLFVTGLSIDLGGLSDQRDSRRGSGRASSEHDIIRTPGSGISSQIWQLGNVSAFRWVSFSTRAWRPTSPRTGPTVRGRGEPATTPRGCSAGANSVILALRVPNFFRSAPLCSAHLGPRARDFCIPTSIACPQNGGAVGRRPLTHSADICRAAVQAPGNLGVGQMQQFPDPLGGAHLVP